MLDLVLLIKAVLIAGSVAALVMWLITRGAPRSWRRSACWSWAIGAGVLAASAAVDQWTRWPAIEDRARFLTLLVPLTVVVETLAAIVRSNSAAWIMRLSLAAAVAPILLHNTVYLADLNGPGTAQWSPAQARVVLCGIAVTLLLVWAALSALQSRTSTPAVFWILSLDAFAAAVTVMLSGYFRAGLLGLGLAGALAGAMLAAHITKSQSHDNASLGQGVIGVFTVVLMGRLFGTLSTGLAACLLLAPLLAWIAELSRLRTLAPKWRVAARLTCVAVPLVVVVFVAQRKFTAASIAHSRPSEPGAAPP